MFTNTGDVFLLCSTHPDLHRAPRGSGQARFILAGIDEKSLLQAVDTAVQMHLDGNHGIPVPDYAEENVSTKVAKLIQSYTGVVDKMPWQPI